MSSQGPENSPLKENGSEEVDEQFFWGIRGPETSFIKDMLRSLRAHSPHICDDLEAHLSRDEHRKEPKAFDGSDAGAMVLIHLLEAIVHFHQLKLEVMRQPHLSPSKGRVPSHFLLVQSDLLKMEPALFHLAHMAHTLRLCLWGEVPDSLDPVFQMQSERKKKPKKRTEW